MTPVAKPIPLILRTGTARGNRFAAIGDSITQRGANDALGTLSPGSWLTFACMLSGQRLLYTRNAGVSGETTTQMLARIQTDVIAYAPAACAILGGANDVIAGGYTLAATSANIKAMARLLLLNNILPVLCTTPPRTDGAYNNNVTPLNAWIVSYAARNGYPLIDMYKVVTDPTNGNWKSGYSADGIHPSAAAALLMGQEAATVLAGWFPTWGPPLPLSPTDASNLLANGVFVGDANSDGRADSWAGNALDANMACSLVSDANYGNWQRIVWTGATQRFVSQAITTGWSVGDTLAFMGRVSATVAAGNTPVTLEMIANGNDPKRWRPLDAMLVDLTSAVFYYEHAVPDGTTTLTVQAYNSIQGTGATLDMAQFKVVNLTALGVA